MVLNLKGLQLYSNVDGRPLDAPKFQPIFEMMARFDLPVWIHPTYGATATDYPAENQEAALVDVLLRAVCRRLGGTGEPTPVGEER